MENEKDQIPEESVETTEEKTVETKKGILLTPGKLVGLIIGVVVLVALLVGAIVYGMGGFDKVEDEVAIGDVPATTVPVETVPATTPADTGEDNVTHKGSYTVSDEEIVKLADTVVATAGDAVLTNEDLQIYYWMQVQNFLSRYYYNLSSFGLDFTQPLDTQICVVMENGYTWQQYFLEQALNNWHSYQSLANMAKENGIELSAENQEYLAGLAENLTTSAQTQGYPDAEGLVQFNVGAGGSLDAYIAYETLFLQGDGYYNQQKNAIELTEEEIEAYFDANAEAYAESGITKDNGVDVRHVLVIPEGKNPGDEYTDEEWASCEADAQALLDQWLAGDASEESFAALANAHSVDSDGTDGGLYRNINADTNFVTNFKNWCLDESRQYGDYGLVKTEYGYHIMYFAGATWLSYAETGLMQEKTGEIVTSAWEKYPMEVDYSAIALGLVDISKWFG